MNEPTAYAITDGSGWFWWTFQPTREQAIEHFAGSQEFEPGRAKWAKAMRDGYRCEEIELRITRALADSVTLWDAAEEAAKQEQGELAI